MASAVEDLRERIERGFNLWTSRVKVPYCIAYAQAYTKYQEVARAQAEADKARAELFVTLAGCVTGSILMATVAETSIRKLIGNAALDAICNRNLTSTFNAMSVLADNRLFMFALGKSLDVLKDQADHGLKAEMVKRLSYRSDIVTSEPSAKSNEIEGLLTEHMQAAIDMVAAVDNRKHFSESKKSAALLAIGQAAICIPPLVRMSETNLANKLELGIYMQVILASDSLITVSGTYDGAIPIVLNRKPIQQAPSSRTYPNPPYPDQSGGQMIDYNVPGGQIRSRIDELNVSVFGKKFYTVDNRFSDFLGFGPGGNQLTRKDELVRAEQSLDRLSATVRPDSLLQVKT